MSDTKSNNVLTLREHVGAAIKQRRIDTKTTQVQLAKRLKVAQSYLSQIESGHNNITLDKLEEIAEALDAKVEITLSPKRCK